ncbi:hypothetical protein [Halobellus sp. GM3]|uniref:hypothetical protein n=1 Tax=Halobellus sp. GM3 TaxID=3458410 RepID=UPI00403DB9C8
MRNGHLSAIILVCSLIFLAGCGSVVGGPSVSDPRTDTIEGQPAIVFNYSVDDYSDVLLTGPDGDVINEGTLEPDDDSGALLMSTVKPGTYSIVIQQGGETALEEEITFEGSEASVTSVEGNWSGNRLRNAEVTIENTGDLPAGVTNATISVRDTTVTDPTFYYWIAPGDSRTVSIAPMFGSVGVDEAGPARVAVDMESTNGNISGEFSRTFQGPNLEITNQSANWDGEVLESSTVTVQNTGDLPTSAEVEIYDGNEELASTLGGTIEPGESVVFEPSSLGPIYEAESGGEVQLSIVVNSSSGTTTGEFTRSVSPADLSFDSITPTWQNGQLSEVEFTVTNTGDASTNFNAELNVRGESVSDSEVSIAGQNTETFAFTPGSFSGPLYTVTSGGEVPITVSIETDSQTLSESASERFEDPQAEFSNVDPLFMTQYDSDNEELSSLSFSVRNSGSVALVYDSIRIEIDGTDRTDSPYSSVQVLPGEEIPATVLLSNGISVSSGSHDLTIELRNGGETVVQETVSVSTES